MERNVMTAALIAASMCFTVLPSLVNAEEIQPQESDEPVIEVAKEETEQEESNDEIAEEPAETDTQNALYVEDGYEILPMKHGSISVSEIRMFGEDMYAIWIYPEDGYCLVSISARDEEGNEYITEMLTENVCYARRTEEHLYIQAEFDGAFAYPLTTDMNYDIPATFTENGVPVTQARAGHRIQLKFEPGDQYIIKTLQFLDTCGHILAADETADNTYEFEMNTGSVTVKVYIELIVPYVDEYGTPYVEKGVVDLGNVKGSTLKSGWYVVNRTMRMGERLEIAGDVNLILADGCKLIAGRGIHNTGRNALTLWGQSAGTGTLYSERPHEDYQAAIGGNDDENGGTFNVHGGIIEVEEPGEDAAGIGGGRGGSGGSITIYGGKTFVKYRGSGGGAGIGGGIGGSGGQIYIHGGRVDAGGQYGKFVAGAGIGGGDGGKGGEIVITGGTIEAIGGAADIKGAGAGIGGGSDASGGEIEIYGGKIKATGGDSDMYGVGAGIGGGYGASGGIIRFYGGDTLAVSPFVWGPINDMQGAGIGGGHGGAGGTIEISGGRVEGHGHEAFGKGLDARDSGTLTLGDSIWAGENDSLFPYAQRYEKARNPIAYLIARS